MRAPKSRGAFIVFEGVDRCGKSTQSRLLVDHLKGSGIAAELWRFPDRTIPSGKKVSAYLTGELELDDAAVHMLFSQNRWECREKLEQALMSGTSLIVDRYAYSGAAYTAAKQIAGLELKRCKAPDVGLPKPDLVIYLEMAVELAAGRGGYGEERYEKVAFQKAVQEQYSALKDSNWHVLDASQEIDSLQQQIQAVVKHSLEKCQRGEPLLTLWQE
eukprot:jgi/Astpho2/4422/Aster-00039